MQYQTVFYVKGTGEILNIEPNHYVKSKFDKLRYCPGYNHEEVNFLYFKSAWVIDKAKHMVRFISKTVPPIVITREGVPLFFTDRLLQFMELAAQYKTIIVDLADSMGDQLLRVACVIAAQKKYPSHKFYCKVEKQYIETLSLCPDISLFTSYKELSLNPANCGKVMMNGGHLYDPRGKGFNKACVYGTWLNLSFVPYEVELVTPPDFPKRFVDFAMSVGVRPDQKNIVFQLRSKEWEGKCWDVSAALDLAACCHLCRCLGGVWLAVLLDDEGRCRGFLSLGFRSLQYSSISRSLHCACKSGTNRAGNVYA